MKFLVITAFYDKGDRYRRRNLVATLTHNTEVFDDAFFCVAEMNPTGWFDDLKFSEDRIKHVTIKREGPFCKTALLNKAVLDNPDYDVIVMVDGDVFLSQEVVDYIRNNWDRGSLVFPFSEAQYLKETDTKRLIQGMPLLPGYKDHGAVIDRQTGLCNVFTRDTFEKVGHYDEDFVGWGAEDDAFLTKCKRLVGPIHRNRKPGYIAYHLFHPVVNTVDYIKKNKIYTDNRVRQACIRRMSSEDLEKYIHGKVTLSDMVRKYDDMGRLEIKLEWRCTPNSGLFIDTTIYDVDRTGEMSFAKVMQAIEVEDGCAYCVNFIDDILLAIPDLNEAQIKEIMGLRKHYEEEAAKCSSSEM